MSDRATTKRDRAQGRGWRSVIICLCLTAVAGVYLFVQAPPPLAAEATTTKTMPMRAVFSLLEMENDAARAVWTEEIVKRGTEAGLRFGEHWRDDDVHEGPLPALFLRETARELERRSLGLRVFLGSQYPISAANAFTGEQATRFIDLEHTKKPQMFVEASTGLHTAMFADRAVVDGCVSCHNEHPDSPKTDWRLNDMMGATTWMYPDEMVTAERAVELVRALRGSIRAAYASYLAKAAQLPRPPEVGTRWPRDGYYLPSEDVFMSELERRVSTTTLRGLIEPEWAIAAAADDKPAASAVAASTPPPVQKPASELPTLVIRSARATHVTVEQGDARLMVARIPAGGVVVLTAHPPLQLRFTRLVGVEVEYAGKRIPVPTEDNGDRDIEIIAREES